MVKIILIFVIVILLLAILISFLQHMFVSLVGFIMSFARLVYRFFRKTVLNVVAVVIQEIEGS